MAKPKPFVLYPKNAAKKLDRELFREPSAEYRGTPFWSWNSSLGFARLKRQIDVMKQMGFGGFHIHSRTGLTDEYLGEKYMNAVVECTDYAAEQKMLSWLYDEDRWPSGFAGGLVTKDVEFRARHLLWTSKAYSGEVAQACQDERAAGTRSENGTLLGRYVIELTDGWLGSYRKLRDRETPKRGAIWYAYLEVSQPSSWFNHQTYCDTFNPAATRRFIETTHERFKAAVGGRFGGVVPAIFTDEPQFPKKTTFLKADEARDIIMPWTDDFCDSFAKQYGHRIEDSLPEIYWNLPDDLPSVTRYQFHEHTAERFAAGFGDVLGEWCGRNGIALTGHMLGEPNLYSQTRGIGEGMRPLRSFQLPGIDMLCDRLEYTTAKQAQSVARQYGRPGVCSELYGVTNWDYDFVGHKAQGDWQAALGVTVRVPHLAWLSMAGESKRDYPAPIGPQSPWFAEYSLVENHFSRLNTVMTRGKPHVRVGVIHPIESYWLCFGPIEQNQIEMQRREEAYRELITWLSFSLVDFDLISEGLLPSQSKRQAGRSFAVGEMKYDVVVVPGMRTIRNETLRRLEAFADDGGRIIFVGEIPSLVDAKPSRKPAKLAAQCERIEYARGAVLAALEPHREIEIKQDDGSAADTILHQLRIDGDRRYLFLVNTDRQKPRAATIRLSGRWSAERLDTMSGDSFRVATTIDGQSTEIVHTFEAHGHLLLELQAAKKSVAVNVQTPNWKPIAVLDDPVEITLSEPNCLLLDQAEWRLDEGPWQPREELLRLDNLARKQLGLPLRAGRIAQPWTDTLDAPPVATLTLRFRIDSTIETQAKLALENAAAVELWLNGKQCRAQIDGYYVDEAIDVVQLPPLVAGQNELLVKLPFSRKTDVEWCYLLGDFGVDVRGRHSRVVEPVRKLSFGDWTRQGLPFYGGNVTYHCTVPATTKPLAIEAPKFRNPLLVAAIDGQRIGSIAFAPFRLPLGTLKPGDKLDITAFGNRVNSFGPLHNTNEKLTWVAPAAWRSEGSRWWTYGYQLKPTGILVAPTLLEAD